jgi:glycine/D-amino acid oxidase-like deaminating enzyme
VRWTGSLAWTDKSTPVSEGARPGPGQHWVGRSEIAALEPNLQTPPEWAVYAPTDGGVDPVRITEAFVQAARMHGAQVVLGSAVTSLKAAGGRVEGVMTSAGFHPASTVVLAAGVNVPALCEPLGVRLPVAVSPAFLMRVATPPGLVRTILASPHYEAREAHDGNLLMTAPHAGRLSGTALQQLAQHTLDRLRSTFGGNGALRLLGHGIGRRPMPLDGPIAGYVTPDKSVYVAVMHSAVTLAPTIGRLLAKELVSGEPVTELERCRPHQFPS